MDKKEKNVESIRSAAASSNSPASGENGKASRLEVAGHHPLRRHPARAAVPTSGKGVAGDGIAVESRYAGLVRTPAKLELG